MVFPLNQQLQTTCRWLLDRYHLDENPSQHQPQKLATMDSSRPSPGVQLPIPLEPDNDPTPNSNTTPNPHHDPSSASLQTSTTPLELEEVAPDDVSDAKPAMIEEPEISYKLPTWPSEQIPVEIFELITSHLSRAEVKTLRLVCREFESKVSARYFKNVVVPFRSELYGTLSRDEFGARKHPSSALLSNGMRIFESFGPYILRFALSLEINEDALAHPPIKPTQAAVPSFWGVYRWPHQSYNRYSDLEGIEQTADEIEGMKEALRHLTKVTNLGLCCDAGLGFLVHPDRVARKAKMEQPVFSMQNWRREQRASGRPQDDGDVVTIADFNGRDAPRRKRSSGDALEFKRTILRKMVKDAGFPDSEVNGAINMILETEGTDLTRIDLDERPSSYWWRDTLLALVEGDSSTWRTFSESDPERAERSRYPLMPASLTRAQKELLLELEWAHRAMIQSYVIAMIDNASVGSFNSLTTLTIAKIPSSHIHILYRNDFWESFPNLANLSLGVIPDWRRISKPAPGCIEDEPVSPLEAVSKAYRLLQHYVGRQPSIESLHFEWICGGEFAPSSFQRNQYVLPAPFLDDPDRMVLAAGAAAGTERLLVLPHVKHLSLKNCWASPHVLLQTVRQMALSSLEKLELETVSLSGQPSSVPQFPIFHQNMLQVPQGFNAAGGFNHMVIQNGFLGAAQQAHMINLGLGPVAAPPHAQQQPEHVANIPVLENNEPPPPETADHLTIPEWLSWAGFVEHFSPGISIRKILEEEDEETNESSRTTWAQRLDGLSEYLPRTGRLISDEKRYNLKCLSFKSCGYIHVEASNVNTRALLPPGAQGLIPPMNNHLLPPRLMQRCRDKMLGQIIPYMRPQETFNLTTAYNMEMGWGSVYDAKVAEDAVADGVDYPGMGRFSGLVEACHSGIWTGYSSSSEGSGELPETITPLLYNS